jgi:hypothetical protein
MIHLVIYRRDLYRLRQMCEVHLRAAGTLWCEISVDTRDYLTITQHGIWHEPQGATS